MDRKLHRREMLIVQTELNKWIEGDVDWWIRRVRELERRPTLVVLAEEQGLVPSTNVVAHKHS